MNEQDVRSLVREAIERHLGRPDGPARAASHRIGQVPDVDIARAPSSHGHSSHMLLRVVPGSEADGGLCVIEPSVRCNHCGFCQSYGH